MGRVGGLARLLACFLASMPVGAGTADLDSSFGSGGVLQLPARYGALTVLPDGRFQAVRVDDGVVRVLRLDVDGHPDAGFGTLGVLESEVEIPAGVSVLGAAGMDKTTYISVTVSVPGTPALRVIRILESGRVDASFGSAGVLALPTPPLVPFVSVADMVIGADGDLLLAAGFYRDYYDCTESIRTYKITPRGDLDAGFGTDGWYRIASCIESPFLLVPQADGGVHVGPPLLETLDAQGRLTATSADWVKWFVGHDDVQLLRRGQHVYAAALEGPAASGPSLTIARWRQDLSRDTSFGSAGTVTIGLGALPVPPMLRWSMTFGAAAAAQVGPYLYVSFQLEGSRDPASGKSGTWVVARVLDDGRLDTSFGRDGFVTSPLLWLVPLLQQPDGSLLVANTGGVSRIGKPGATGAGVVGALMPCAYPATEQTGSLIVHLGRDLGTRGAASVRYSTMARTAAAGDDYTPVSGTLVWADGDISPKSVTIPIVDDTAFEQTEWFQLQFELAAGDALLNCTSVDVNIQSDDPAPVVPQAQPASPQVPSTPSAEGGGGSLAGSAIALLAGLLLWVAWRRHRRRGAEGRQTATGSR